MFFNQEIPRITGKFGFGVQNEAGWRLTELYQENTFVIAAILLKKHKRQLYIWMSSDGQYRNQTNYFLCSRRWRSYIQLAKTRAGANGGPDHELLIARFTLKQKK